jgi:hypothetical protein
MWEPGPWAMPMGSFGWIFPIVGLAICVFVIAAIVRATSGRGFMCMSRDAHGTDAVTDLRREVRELREEVNRLKSAR